VRRAGPFHAAPALYSFTGVRLDTWYFGLYNPEIVARTKEFDPQQTLKAAIDVFWRSGYAQTSLDDLMDAMKIGRQSLYDTFGYKRTLYLSALSEYHRVSHEARRHFFASGLPIRECFTVIFRQICDESESEHSRGCFLLNANIERSADDAEVAAIVHKNLAEIETSFERALRHAQEIGDLAREKHPAALASFMLATVQGMRQAARAGSDRITLTRIANIAVSTLD
jgi:TetR/AcrR family transcriptional repressor of nem operon